MWSSFLATYKRDLEEFVSTVRSDTEQVIGFLVEGPATTADLQAARSTFIDDPSDAAYPAYFASFDLAAHAEEVQAALRSSATLRQQLADLVPEFAASDEFWARYLYKKAKLPAESSAEAPTTPQRRPVEMVDVLPDVDDEDESLGLSWDTADAPSAPAHAPTPTPITAGPASAPAAPVGVVGDSTVLVQQQHHELQLRVEQLSAELSLSQTDAAALRSVVSALQDDLAAARREVQEARAVRGTASPVSPRSPTVSSPQPDSETDDAAQWKARALQAREMCKQLKAQSAEQQASYERELANASQAQLAAQQAFEAEKAQLTHALASKGAQVAELQATLVTLQHQHHAAEQASAELVRELRESCDHMRQELAHFRHQQITGPRLATEPAVAAADTVAAEDSEAWSGDSWDMVTDRAQAAPASIVPAVVALDRALGDEDEEDDTIADWG